MNDEFICIACGQHLLSYPAYETHWRAHHQPLPTPGLSFMMPDPKPRSVPSDEDILKDIPQG